MKSAEEEMRSFQVRKEEANVCLQMTVLHIGIRKESFTNKIIEQNKVEHYIITVQWWQRRGDYEFEVSLV